MDFVTKLPDGTEITIAGGAANVSSEVESVRIVVTPTAKGLSKKVPPKNLLTMDIRSNFLMTRVRKLKVISKKMLS